VVDGAPGIARRWPGNAMRFLVAVTLSMYGDWLTTVALVVLLYRLTGSATAPAGYILVRVAPRVLGVGPGGLLADRRSPVAVLAACWGAQGLLTAALVAVSRTGSLVGIFLCVGIDQFLNALSSPCTGAIIPRLGRRTHIARINRVYAAAQSSSVFVVPLIGSALLLLTSVQLLLLIDAMTFFVGAALVSRIPLEEREANGVTTGKAQDGPLAGLRVAVADPVLRVLLATFYSGAMVVTTLQAVLVVAAAERLGNAGEVGWLYSAAGFGGVIGTAVVARWRPRQLSGALLAAIGLAELASYVGFALVPAIGASVTFLATSSIAGVIGETWGAIDLQERVRVGLLGRVSAAVDLSLYTGMLVGAILGLVLTPALHWQTVIVIVGSAGSAAVLLAFVATLMRSSSAR